MKIKIPGVNGAPETVIDLSDEQLVANGLVLKATVDTEFVPLGKHNSDMATERKKAKGKVSREELLADDDFLTSLVEERGDDLRTRLGVKKGTDQETMNKLIRDTEARVREKEVKPLEAKVGKMEGLARNGDIHTQLSSSGVADDAKEALVALFGPRLKPNEEGTGWFLAGADGQLEATPYPGKDRSPYKTVADQLREWKEGNKNLLYFAPQGRDGNGFNGGRATPPGGNLLQQAEALEGQGKFAEADALKSQHLTQMQARQG